MTVWVVTWDDYESWVKAVYATEASARAWMANWDAKNGFPDGWARWRVDEFEVQTGGESGGGAD